MNSFSKLPISATGDTYIKRVDAVGGDTTLGWV